MRLRNFCLMMIAALWPVALRAEVPSNYTIVTDIDLSEMVQTKKKWTLTIAQEPSDEREPFGDYLHFYFYRDGQAQCLKSEIFDGVCAAPDYSNHANDRFNVFHSLSIIRPNALVTRSLLLIRVASSFGGSGHPITTMLWNYDRKRETFELVFHDAASPNNNEETRVVQDGPLSGYILEARQGSKAPYGYLMTAYRPTKLLQYVQVLKYIGRTRYNDGNRLSVIDAEMPEIERRLNLWKPGDPIPRPPVTPEWCKTLSLRNGVVWCETE